MEDISYDPALNFCYRPLYFEEVNAERYGYSFGLLQPAVSIAEFYGHVVLLPYRLVARRPGFATYHDHQFRPGGTAPREVAYPNSTRYASGSDYRWPINLTNGPSVPAASQRQFESRQSRRAIDLPFGDQRLAHFTAREAKHGHGTCERSMTQYSDTPAKRYSSRLIW